MTPRRPDRIELVERELTRKIIRAFFVCYNELGYGFLESVYRRALSAELRADGLHVEEEFPVEVRYKGLVVGSFKLDVIVERRVIVATKATALLGAADKRQLINYLRATSLEVGLLLHFGPEPRFERCINAKQLYSRVSNATVLDPVASETSV